MKIINSKNGMLSRGLMLAGLLITIGAVFRWTIMYNDLSQCLFWASIGAGIGFVGWSHGMFRFLGDRVTMMQRQLDTIGAYVTDNIELAVKEEMYGKS